VDRLRPGLRQVSVRGGLLELNGRQIALRGAAIQEDIPGHGPALTPADITTIVDGLKRVHANVTRAHYLLNPKLLDALDAAGIMVLGARLRSTIATALLATQPAVTRRSRPSAARSFAATRHPRSSRTRWRTS